MSLTILIFTCNEEINIRKAILSAKKLTPNIIVIDSESEDATLRIANQLGVKVFTVKKYDYVEPARSYGISKTETDWILVLDADERLSSQLIGEIQDKIKTEEFSHYKIPRKNIFANVRWLRYGGWWPDYQVRLIKRKYFRSWPVQIHSVPVISGNTGHLDNPLIHYFHPSLENMLSKTIVFEQIEAQLLFEAEKKVTTLTFFRKYIGELYRRLIKYQGLREGTPGIIESIYQAFSKTITHIYLYEKKEKNSTL
ncbi:hypothetical protein A3J15_00655 [Candidatus Roizmanbacteria bacterium RIFCSPLOWO2_02_FULL_38_10]|uniref:Glycosyltransferase 2-like domain-containing protein n=1 Tax=Candidatus Roizmanbacteria bacterium RIFCSPLOWO2_02_FULL_38_10 TaxID=1802074 RepID=A0A1F7JMR4_9BACT|nr:MAG: hypothetical protein A3J15_00655 [Candidatus Roizmanbacteria bacterium RIFCSPLOWO2_02_FULL_38_10]